MINLIGCSKENFFKLLELMQYTRKKTGFEKEDYFVYKPKFVKTKSEKINKNNPFEKLANFRFR